MQKQLIYDLPTRIFHWAFAGLFIIAFFIAKTIDDDNPLFSLHMLAGLMLGGLVALRMVWGFVGSKYARFQSFALHPRDLICYIKGVLTGDKKRWSGHNPAASWATLIMLSSTVMLAVTGILMSSGHKEAFEDLHEVFANVFLVTVLLHIAGVILHTFRHHDGIGFSMVHGKKRESDDQGGISGHRQIVALLLVVLMGSFGSYLFKNYNPTTQELQFFGMSLQMGDSEKEDEGEENHVKIDSQNQKKNNHDNDD